jgi:ATP/maltotriose-dependent transcriptional regulator MalT
MVSAPPGSGKTVLLRSWIDAAGLAERTAWVPVGRDERDPQRLWLSVLGALRQTAPGSHLVRELTAAPDLDGWAMVERLLKDLAPLDEPLWLVIDDVHELGSDQARRQLELLLMRAPPELRFVLATRHDVRLGLHRLRLEGELTEIRADDLRFSLAEARELLTEAGVELTDPALARLTARTEGWAAGLRLAALSLAGHPDPERFAVQFSGSERTVAEYLLAEVLERQPEEVRRLLLRTSVLDRVNGELADLLTGGSGGERVLQDLEEANAFVVAVDAARSWFRYHHLFADLLQLELRRTEPGEVAGLHKLAATWSAGMDSVWTRSGMPRRRRTGDGPPGCWPTTGPACTWMGRLPPCIGSWSGFPLKPARPMPSWRRWRRPMSWRRGRWKRPSGIWDWRSAGSKGSSGRRRPAGAGRRWCCSQWSGCCWPGSAATCWRWPRRRSGCRSWLRRGPA